MVLESGYLDLLSKVFLFVYLLLFGWFWVGRRKIPQWYIVILYFILFRIVFDYNKCTISYIECKFRQVPKKLGYIYQFLQSVNDLRNNKLVFTISILLTILVTWKYFIIDKSSIRI